MPRVNEKVKKNVKKIIKNDEVKKELKLQKPDGTIIWTRAEEEKKRLKNEDDVLAGDLKSQFGALIKQCHQILYNNGAIVGKKAMDDIMKILTLKLLQPLFEDGQILKTKTRIRIRNTDPDSQSC